MRLSLLWALDSCRHAQFPALVPIIRILSARHFRNAFEEKQGTWQWGQLHDSDGEKEETDTMDWQYTQSHPCVLLIHRFMGRERGRKGKEECKPHHREDQPSTSWL